MAKRQSKKRVKTGAGAGAKTKVRLTSPTLRRLRAICLALPEATETLTWGHPLFRAAGKIFVAFGQDGGGETMSVKVGKARQRELIRDRRYSVAPYVGRFGGVSFRLAGRIDWDEVTALVLESYRRIAPRRLVSKMDDCRSETTAS